MQLQLLLLRVLRTGAFDTRVTMEFPFLPVRRGAERWGGSARRAERFRGEK